MKRRHALRLMAGGAALGACGNAFTQTAKKRLAVLHPRLDDPPDKEAFARLFERQGFRIGHDLEIVWYEFPVRSDWQLTLKPASRAWWPIARIASTHPANSGSAKCARRPARFPSWVMSRRATRGRNLTLFAQCHQSALISDAHLAEIRAQRPDAVDYQGVASAIALRNVLPHIPVVTWGVEDPVAAGLAESFTRPGGSVTGLTQGCSAIYPKQVDFLLKAVPDLKGIAVMGAQRDVMEDDADRQYRHLTVAIRARNLSYLPVPGTGRRRK